MSSIMVLHVRVLISLLTGGDQLILNRTKVGEGDEHLRDMDGQGGARGEDVAADSDAIARGDDARGPMPRMLKTRIPSLKQACM